MEPALPSPSSVQDYKKSKFSLLESNYANITHTPSKHTLLPLCKVLATPEDISVTFHLISISLAIADLNNSQIEVWQDVSATRVAFSAFQTGRSSLKVTVSRMESEFLGLSDSHALLLKRTSII